MKQPRFTKLVSFYREENELIQRWIKGCTDLKYENLCPKSTQLQTFLEKIFACTNLPWCFDISINLNATLAMLMAPSTTASGEPTKVYTVRFVDGPGSTSSKVQPSVFSAAAAIASITWIESQPTNQMINTVYIRKKKKKII